MAARHALRPLGVEQLEYGWNYDLGLGSNVVGVYHGPPDTPNVGPYPPGQEIKPAPQAINTIIDRNQQFVQTL